MPFLWKVRLGVMTMECHPGMIPATKPDSGYPFRGRAARMILASHLADTLHPTLTTWPLTSAKLVLCRCGGEGADSVLGQVAERAVWVWQRHRRGSVALALVACMSLLYTRMLESLFCFSALTTLQTCCFYWYGEFLG